MKSSLVLFLLFTFFTNFYVYSNTHQKWTYESKDTIQTSPAIGDDGTIYFGSRDDHLHAVDSNGTMKWKFESNGISGFEPSDTSSPAIGENGDVYFGSKDGVFYALSPEGMLVWKHYIGKVFGAPAIALDGTIYVTSFIASTGYLTSFSAEGSQLWRLSLSEPVTSSPIISQEGIIYITTEVHGKLYAIDNNGNIKWIYDTNSSGIQSSPAIGPQGTIYFGNNTSHVFAINSNGTLKWKFKAEKKINSSPSIDKNGNVYIGSHDNYLYSITNSGTLSWKYLTGGQIESSPALGIDGTIYVGSSDSFLYAISPDGELRWRYPTNGSILSSPSLSIDGTLYFGSNDGYLYALSTGSYGLLKEGWPKISGNNKNTGKVIEPNDDYDNDSITDRLDNCAAIANSAQRDTDSDGKGDACDEDDDGDGIPDQYEFEYGLDSLDASDATLDSDRDGLDNLQEFQFGSDVSNPDSDNDGIKDGDEIKQGTSPVTGKIKWKTQSTKFFATVPALDLGGNIYYTSIDNITAIKPDGSFKWRVNDYGPLGSPVVISPDGHVYFNSLGSNFEGKKIALNAISLDDGSPIWSYSPERVTSISHVALGENGTIYFGVSIDSDDSVLTEPDHYFSALNPDGTIAWSEALDSPVSNQPAVSSDNGTIYAVATKYHTSIQTLYAFSSKGTTLWSFDLGNLSSAGPPSLGKNGDIYISVGSNGIYSISKDGSINWYYEVRASHRKSVVIGTDESLYFGTQDGFLVALNENGSLKWEIDLGERYLETPVVGKDGTIYALSWLGHFFAVNSNGSIAWEYSHQSALEGPPALGEDGSIYFGTSEGTLFSVYSDSFGLGETSWPKTGKNIFNTASSVSLGTKTKASYDYDGDGISDIVIRRPDVGQFIIARSSDDKIMRGYFGSLVSDIPLSGDFDGDGTTDIAIRRDSIKQFIYRTSTDNNINRIFFGSLDEDIPVIADYDGDGIDDVAIRRPSTGQWFIKCSATGTIKRETFGTSVFDTPAVADYDGDGKADIAVRRTNTGQFIIKYSSTDNIDRIYFGSHKTDIAVPADYDGDGKADIAIRRPSNGYWFIKRSSDNVIERIFFGSQEDDIPVVADYDGDGIADLAIRRPTTGNWIVKQSSNDAYMRMYFGSEPTDIPLAGPLSQILQMTELEEQNNNIGNKESFELLVIKPDTKLIKEKLQPLPNWQSVRIENID